MKGLLILIALFVALQLCGQPVKIIFDTDMESDVDDVAALAMLHGLADRGEAEILATISSSLNPWSAPVIEVINRYYNRKDIPVGSVKTLGVYRNSIYARTISEKYTNELKLGEYAPNATTLYREILSNQPKSSVVIVTVGYLTNISKLLRSGPDKHSPLTGKELIEKKVKYLVCMGGGYPSHLNPIKFGNLKPDPASSVHVAQDWPVRIIYTAGGRFANMIKSGKILFDEKPKNSPVYEAYKIFLKDWGREYHHSADLIAVYVAVRGNDDFFKVEKQGYNHIFDDGTNVWRRYPDKPNHWIIGEMREQVEPEEVVKSFDSLIIK